MGRTSCAKENLITSAIELIGTRSYNAVGVQELCEHAGVKKGSFYHFFPSKRDLTLEALDQIWNKFKVETLDPIFNSEISPIDKFKTLLARSYEYQSSRKDCTGCMTGCGFGNLALELSTQDEEIRKKIEEIFCEWTQYLERLILQSIEEGVLPSDTDPAATAQAMVAYIEGVYLLGKTFNDPCMIQRLGEGVLKLCIPKKKTDVCSQM
ncbi:MAG TPA: TetR/AcrR family transcriptional regulator [Thermodesulfobacteriota bacterium]|nr:TetR/AcrR family transcriptional regulator [Thermodesulfobacteriota bacterium]